MPKHPKEIRTAELPRRRCRKGAAKITKGGFHFKKKKKTENCKNSQEFWTVLMEGLVLQQGHAEHEGRCQHSRSQSDEEMKKGFCRPYLNQVPGESLC